MQYLQIIRSSKIITNYIFSLNTMNIKHILPFLSSDKKSKIKELTLGDVISAQIRTQNVPDRTLQYQKFLYEFRKGHREVPTNIFMILEKQRKIQSKTVRQRKQSHASSNYHYEQQGQQNDPILMIPDIMLIEQPQQVTVQKQINLLFDRISSINKQQNHQNEKVRTNPFGISGTVMNTVGKVILDNYNGLLNEVYEKLSKELTLNSSINNIQQGQQSIQDLINQLHATANLITTHRKKLLALKHHSSTQYHKTTKKLNQKINLQKVLYIMKFWKQYQLNTLFKHDPSKSKLQQLIHSVKLLNTLQHQNPENSYVNKVLPTNLKQSNNLQKTIYQKYEKLRIDIQTDMQRAIIQYNSKENYVNTRQSYLKMLEIVPALDMIEDKKKYSFKMENMFRDIHKMIMLHLKIIYTETLQSTLHSHLNNLELLNQDSYYKFFHKLLMLSYPKYLKNWHSVTSIHLDIDPQIGQQMVRSRHLIVQSILQQTTNAIKFSQRFNQIDQRYKSGIMEMIYLFIRLGYDWAGKKANIYQSGNQNSIGKILLSKMQNDLEIFFKMSNGEIKNQAICELQFNNLTLEISSPVKNKENKNQKQLPLYYHINNIHIQELLADQINFTTAIQNNKTQQLKIEIPQPILFTKLGHYLYGLCLSYMQRCNNLPKNMHVFLNYMEQHFEYLIYLLYRLTFTDNVKLQIYEDIVTYNNETINEKLGLLIKQNKQVIETTSKIKQKIGKDKSAMTAGRGGGIGMNASKGLASLTNVTYSTFQLEKEFPSMINDLRIRYIRKVAYKNIYKVIQKIGSKFDHLTINNAGCINTNKIIEFQGQQLRDMFFKKLIKLFQDVIQVSVWITQLIKRQDIKMPHKTAIDFSQLTSCLIQLSMLSFHSYHYQYLKKKYYTDILQLMSPLKWQIKKYNQQNANQYRQYKIKLLQLYRNDFQMFKILFDTSSHTGLYKNALMKFQELFIQNQVETMYKALLETYGKIDKINDNGRQIIKLDSIQIGEILKQFGLQGQKGGYWCQWFDRYADIINEKRLHSLLQRLQHMGLGIQNQMTLDQDNQKTKMYLARSFLSYPFTCWRYSLMKIMDGTSKQKRDYHVEIVKLYCRYLTDAFELIKKDALQF